MFSLKKIGAAVAFAALTSFSASVASAATISFLPGDAIPSPNFENLYVFRNGTSDLVPGGDLTAGLGFDADESTTPDGAADGLGNTFSFTVDASINPPGTHLPVSYAFSVTFDDGQNGVGIADLTFNVFRDGVISNTFVLTDGSGVSLGSSPTFLPTFLDGEVIDWTVSGTVLANGGSYQIAVTAIPLPASVLMLVGALAGLGFVGRMKKSRFAAV